MPPGYQSDLFPVAAGDPLLFLPVGTLRPKEAGHEADVSAADLREAENLSPASATIPMGAPSSPDVVQIWASDEKSSMGDDPDLASLDLIGVGSPISPDKCRLRRPSMRVTSVCAPLRPGPVIADHVNMDYVKSQGWAIYTHPDGTAYLYHSSQQTVVEHPGYDEGLDRYILLITAKMLRLRMGVNRYLESSVDSSACELFLRVDPESQEVLYYFTDWNRRSVFWLHPYTLERPFSSVSQLQHLLQYQFWEHVARFPSHRLLPEGSREALQSLLTYQVIDVVTNALSTAPYSTSDATSFLGCLTRSYAQAAGGIDGALNGTVARLWVEQCRLRFQHLYGTPHARAERTERRAMAPMEAPRRWYQVIGLLLLFNEPYNFYLSLMDIFVDEVIYERSWKAFYQDTLREEWKDHAFMATVCLAANMAFLTVGNVGGNVIGSDSLSPTSQVLSLCSTIFSIGSIVIGKSLPNFHRRLQNCSAFEAAQYMTSFSKRHRNGLYRLAMLFSLPFALFMWSLALFVAALFSFAFGRWAWSTGIPVVLVSAGIVGVLMTSLVFLRAGSGQFFITTDVSGPQPSGWRHFVMGVESVPQGVLRMMRMWCSTDNWLAGGPQSESTIIGQAPEERRQADTPPREHQLGELV
ncbi:hypothetical protein AURDEDRAFT_117226, partial [Auricularia subglabra TFB-10046 SS5]